jgi:hypothetical protein
MMSESEEHGSLLEKINDKIHEFKKGSSSSSSSDSDDDKKPHKSKKKKLFGRKHPLHHVLGGGKGILSSFQNMLCIYIYEKVSTFTMSNLHY